MAIYKLRGFISIASRLCFCFILLLNVALINSCGYTIQGSKDIPFQSITIGNITNKTYEPKLQDKLLSSLNQQLMLYGFDVSKNARYRLEGEINRFNLRILSEIGLTAVEYEVDIGGAFTLIDTETFKRYPIKVFKPYMTVFTTQDRLTNVLIQKEIYTQKALDELSKEIVQGIIYFSPTN
ncbi:MAG: LPS assembly lipoprotein LptE [Thermodesulfovibrionales bacterium]|nr:LPS assembly lipoprotein LptE [Thermodesulfovibrionales bacterium]